MSEAPHQNQHDCVQLSCVSIQRREENGKKQGYGKGKRFPTYNWSTLVCAMPWNGTRYTCFAQKKSGGEGGSKRKKPEGGGVLAPMQGQLLTEVVAHLRTAIYAIRQEGGGRCRGYVNEPGANVSRRVFCASLPHCRQNCAPRQCAHEYLIIRREDNNQRFSEVVCRALSILPSHQCILVSLRSIPPSCKA